MIPFQITFRDMATSNSVWLAAQSRIENLEKFYDRITMCEVVISSPHHHQHNGRLYHIHIHLRLPGDDIVVSRESEMNLAHKDIYIAIRDAFNAVDRRLQDHVRKIRGMTKTHKNPPTAHIARILYPEGFGFIQTSDGREIYFHENTLINEDFENLQTGQEVHFTEKAGDKGPQVSSMSVVKTKKAPIEISSEVSK